MRSLTMTAVGAVLALTAGTAYAQDRNVTIVLSEELELVDPCMASQSNIGRVVLQNIAETVTELVPGEGLQPRLATSWEDRGDGTWRFNLREGVKFSDGSDFTAADVAHSIARTINNDALVCEIGAKYFGGMELTTNVVDDTTLDVTVDPPQPILPLLMSTLTVVPEDAPMDSYVTTPVGTGPYTFDEYNRGQNIKLSANNDWWAQSPEVTGATYVFRADSAVRAAMVETGEAEIAPNISVQDATNPDTDFSYPNSETVYIRIDVGNPPLDDKRVREALNLAIDREAFLGTIMPDGTELASAINVPTTLGSNPDIKPYAYDPDRARTLLEEAKADGVDTGAEIELIGRTNNFGNVLETLEAIQSMLQDVGFNIDLQMYEVAEWIDIYSKPFAEDRKPQLFTAMHDNANGDPVFSMYFKYHSDGLQSAIEDPKVDELITKATAATGDERAALWSELFAYLQEDVISDIMLFHMVGFSRVSDTIDFKPTIRTNSELQLSQISFK
ncbi:ABC transporter substrate-binding protein [Acuticoccus sp. MNP-M23]|uniref:ABC transporter substrate-binding protein n=1 Tax=Acuticoccus sp. MNP-M23 TaxID=3072793 RepID=UPI0028164A93|nr:ABC transporter substrate-binding protein [Acuticoccus sp. MNP-M23]WMS40918.1 ABC transporter substrate-binding protein [Acuticoccus sp. MNP-M23]